MARQLSCLMGAIGPGLSPSVRNVKDIRMKHKAGII